MKNGKITLLLAVLFVSIFFIMTSNVAAQNQNQQNSNQPYQNQGQNQPQSQNQTQAQNQSQSQNQMQSQGRYQSRGQSDLLGDNILGMPVRSKNGQKIGEVQDVIFGRNGKIDQFIIDTGGGFLGMGGKTVAIQRSKLNYDERQGYAIYLGTESDIEQMPDINYNAYAYGYGRGYYPYNVYTYRPYGYGYGPYSNYPHWGANRGMGYGYGYYGGAYPYTGERYSQQQGQKQQRGQQGRQGQGSQGMMMQNNGSARGYYQQQGQPNNQGANLSMSNIIGAEVLTQNGDNVGDIENLVVDRQGRITAAIIDVGGFLGIGSKKVAVSFDTLENIGPYYVMYPGTEQQLENMPAVNPGQFQG